MNAALSLLLFACLAVADTVTPATLSIEPKSEPQPEPNMAAKETLALPLAQGQHPPIPSSPLPPVAYMLPFALPPRPLDSPQAVAQQGGSQKMASAPEIQSPAPRPETSTGIKEETQDTKALHRRWYPYYNAYGGYPYYNAYGGYPYGYGGGLLDLHLGIHL